MGRRYYQFDENGNVLGSYTRRQPDLPLVLLEEPESPGARYIDGAWVGDDASGKVLIDDEVTLRLREEIMASLEKRPEWQARRVEIELEVRDIKGVKERP